MWKHGSPFSQAARLGSYESSLVVSEPALLVESALPAVLGAPSCRRPAALPPVRSDPGESLLHRHRTFLGCKVKGLIPHSSGAFHLQSNKKRRQARAPRQSEGENGLEQIFVDPHSQQQWSQRPGGNNANVHTGCVVQHNVADADRRLFGLRKEGNSDTCLTIGEPLYDCAHMRYPKYRKEKGGCQELGMGNRSCCKRTSAGRNENALKIDGSDAAEQYECT